MAKYHAPKITRIVWMEIRPPPGVSSSDFAARFAGELALAADRFRKSKSQGRSLGSVADYHYPSGFDAGLKFNYGSYVTVINPDQSGEPASGQGRRLVCSGGFMVRTLDFTMARLDHLEWKRKLKSSLDDCEKPAEGQAISHEDCELGKWLHLCGLEKYGRFLLMWELERTHEELHSIAKSIIRMRDSGDRIGARQEFSKMGPISDKVIDLLMEVEKQVAGS